MLIRKISDTCTPVRLAGLALAAVAMLLAHAAIGPEHMTPVAVLPLAASITVAATIAVWYGVRQLLRPVL